jgi:hypothetical protein
MALRSHMLVAARFGPWNQGEHSYARQLWDEAERALMSIISLARHEVSFFRFRIDMRRNAAVLSSFPS